MPDDEFENNKIDDDENTGNSATSENLDGQLQFSVVGDSDKQNKSTISSDLIRGHINTIILRTLDERDKYGYEIMDEIQKKSLGQYELKQPTLYSALKRLEKQGYITAYWKTDEVSLGGRRKYFTLTKLGREFTEQNRKEWEYTRTVIDTLISDKPFDFSEPAPGKVDFSVLKKATTRIPNLNGKNNEADGTEDETAASDEQIEMEETVKHPTENDMFSADKDVDPLYIEVLRFCVEDECASITAIQKRFSISYTRSMEIMNWMEKMNYVAPPQGNKPYEVLLSQKGFSALYGGENEADVSEDIADDIDKEESDEDTAPEGPEKTAVEGSGESESVIVEEEPAQETVTTAGSEPAHTESAAIDANEVKEWIKSAITDAFGDIISETSDEREFYYDGEITDISSGIDTSEDKPELDASLFGGDTEEEKGDENFEPQQIDIMELIKGVVHEVLEQEGASSQPVRTQYPQPAPPEYIQPPVPPQYAEPVPQDLVQQPVQDFVEQMPPEYVQQENPNYDTYQQSTIEQSPLYAPNPPVSESGEREPDEQREKVHENFINFINQTPAGTNENVNPAARGMDTDELIYTNRPEAERNYTDIIYGMYEQTVKYQQRPTQSQQPQQQPAQPQPAPRPRPTYFTKKADEDGLTIYSAEEQADTGVKHSGPYNVGMTIFKASIIPAIYLIILAIMGYVLADRLDVNYVYGSIYLIVGALLLIVCASFALAGYKKHAVRPITHGYISITVVLSIIAILFICILGIALDAYSSTAAIFADVVLPSLAMISAPVYVMGFYLMSESKKVSD